MRRILSVFIAAFIAVSSAFAAGASTFGATKITRTKSNSDFAKISAEIVYLYEEKTNGSSDQSSGGTLRILGRTTDASYNFKRLGAEECVVGDDGRFLLQFNGYSAFKYALDILRSDSEIVYAEPDAIITVSSESEGGAEHVSWGVEALKLDKYSEYIAENFGDAEDFKVAIVDTGVEDIEPLRDRLTAGYDFVENDSDAFEDTSEDSHGTFLAGIVADSTKGTPVRIMPVRVLESDEGYLSVAVNGIYYAVDNGARVVNISLSGIKGLCSSLDDAAEYAEKNNAVVVACSGNFKKDTSGVCPAHIDSVITVSAVGESHEFSYAYSDFGESVDVVAPGDNIVSYGADGKLKTLYGTSMSAAFISAGAALFMIENSACNPSQVQTAIKSVCTDLGVEGFDVYYGNGIPDFSKFIDNPFVFVTGVEFSLDDLKCLVGTSCLPGYGVYPSDATNKEVVFSSSNPAVARVEGNEIYIVSQGVAVITVTTVDGGYTDSITIEAVNPEKPEPKPVGIKIEKVPDKVKYIYKSKESLDLSGIRVNVVYSDSSTKAVEDIRDISVSGFSADKAGNQRITVSYGGFTDEFEITVGYAWWQMIIRILLLGFLWY